MHKVLINGQWQNADSSESFQAINPESGEVIEGEFPVSRWSDCQSMIDAASDAADQLAAEAGSKIADFLRRYADNIESNSEEICRVAASETGLAYSPRLHDVELPRTTRQLRLAADAAETQSWRDPVVDVDNHLATCLGPLGPALIIGPNNFPLAFNAIAGSDFASAIAAGNPVIAKAHPSHPNTSRLLAEQAFQALVESGLPAGTFQMFYQVAADDGLNMIEHPEIAAVGFTGSRKVGMQLKAAADEVGTPIYLEMSSVNPVFFLSSVLDREGLPQELAGSCLLGVGQFCTCPNLFVLIEGGGADRFLAELQSEFQNRDPGVLLSRTVQRGLVDATRVLHNAGAEILAGGNAVAGNSARFENTLLRVDGETFLANASALQTEGFGPLSLGVVAKDIEEMYSIAKAIEGSLTGVVYGSDTEPELKELSMILRRRVGRVIHNKMPTGVAVSPAMNHGGPFPATGNAGFTAVGMPAAIRRFAKLDCYDNVADELLPSCLQEKLSAAKVHH